MFDMLKKMRYIGVTKQLKLVYDTLREICIGMGPDGKEK
jgi:hypothetical protein